MDQQFEEVGEDGKIIEKTPEGGVDYAITAQQYPIYEGKFETIELIELICK